MICDIELAQKWCADNLQGPFSLLRIFIKIKEEKNAHITLLVRELGLQRRTVMKGVTELLRQGLIREMGDPGDKRKKLLVPTATGDVYIRDLKIKANCHNMTI